MTESIFFAGFGGQGILLAGRLLCLAAMAEGELAAPPEETAAPDVQPTPTRIPFLKVWARAS